MFHSDGYLLGVAVTCWYKSVKLVYAECG